MSRFISTHCRTALLTVILISGCQQAATTAAKPPRPQPLPVLAPQTVARMDIPYVPNSGGGPQRMLDIYAPRDAAHAPVVVYIHGGEWAKRDKWEVSFKPAFLNAYNIILVSVNYRLSATAQHPAQVNDIAAAVRWITDNISQYGGDPRKIVLMGHSAGCHLVALVGLDPKPLATVGMKPADLLGVISWSGGAFDLVQKVADGGMYASYIHKNFGDNKNTWFDASPINHIGDAKPMPSFLFVVGEKDSAGSRAINPVMADRINAAGGSARFVIVPGKDHFYCDYDLGKPGDTSGDVLLQFIHDAESRKPAPR